MHATFALRLALVCALGLPWAARAANDFSVAERALFMTNHLESAKPPLSLNYVFRRTGSLEEAFDDKVELQLAAQPDGTCCGARVQFLTGKRAVDLPPVESAQGNPAILYFLERDIREMQRLTRGQANYFRKRIRMAVYQSSSVRDITLPYRGQPVAVQEISISPFLDDPNRPRYEKLANKSYVFLLSPAVPGGLYGIRTRIVAESVTAPPLIMEEMLLEGTDAAASRRQP